MLLKKQSDGTWVQHDSPLIGPEPYAQGWKGHNYGHDFLQTEEGDVYVFYEMVSDDQFDRPWKTEIFVQKMVSPFEVSGQPQLALALPEKPWPSSVRNSGGYLLEGPRVHYISGARVKEPFFLMGFSTGEYLDDSYKMHFAIGKNPEGPYQAILNSQGSDLLDFGSDLKEKFNISRGPGRPVLFQDEEGNWWCITHGVDGLAKDKEGNGHAVRHLYLMPISFHGESVNEAVENFINQFQFESEAGL